MYNVMQDLKYGRRPKTVSQSASKMIGKIPNFSKNTKKSIGCGLKW